jgi:hypothetical protein
MNTDLAHVSTRLHFEACASSIPWVQHNSLADCMRICNTQFLAHLRTCRQVLLSIWSVWQCAHN